MSTSQKAVTLFALPDMPLVEPGADLADLIARSTEAAQLKPHSGDVFVIAQKIVSKAEGRYVKLAEVMPSARARELGALTRKDPRLVEIVLRESTEVVRQQADVLIVAHRLGFVMANAGVDQSNIDHKDGERALLLPENPDASAAAIKDALDRRFKAPVGVIINDSFGRPWRNGVVGVALGVAGLPALQSLVGAPDLFGRPLRITMVAIADQVAAAASLLMGQADEATPVVHVRGLHFDAKSVNGAALIRSKATDLFR